LSQLYLRLPEKEEEEEAKQGGTTEGNGMKFGKPDVKYTCETLGLNRNEPNFENKQQIYIPVSLSTMVRSVPAL
jgi:hypothetical protein